MSQVKLTKNELRQQQIRLARLEKYLPTLKLKKSMLQTEVLEAKMLMQKIVLEEKKTLEELKPATTLLSMAPGWDLESLLDVETLQLAAENIAGVEVPVFVRIDFVKKHHPFSQTPLWWDRLVELAKEHRTLVLQAYVARLRLEALEKELREVSIRVNLFEKILIPRALTEIKRIKIFLQDQELAAVARAKVAKSKHRPEGVQEMLA
jgi:V/A-type H+-transporting ATPase subunit D